MRANGSSRTAFAHVSAVADPARKGRARSPHRATLDGYFAAEMAYVAAGGAEGGADFGPMAAFLHPDVVLFQGPSVPYAGEWHGRKEIERFFSVYTREWQSLALPDVTYYEGEAGVAVTLRMQATARSTGRQVDTPLAHFVTFEKGLIRELTAFYLDPVQVTQATMS